MNKISRALDSHDRTTVFIGTGMPSVLRIQTVMSLLAKQSSNEQLSRCLLASILSNESIVVLLFATVFLLGGILPSHLACEKGILSVSFVSFLFFFSKL